MDARSAPNGVSPGWRAAFDPVSAVHRLRLGSGLVLFSYVLTHLLNHSLGVVSLGWMQAFERDFTAVWQSPPMTVLLAGAAALHVTLALWSIYRRRQLRMPGWEATQLLLGLAIPPVLVDHVVGTTIAQAIYGVNSDYTYVITSFALDPPRAVIQGIFLVIAWTHGCIGLHYWLRLKPWYRRGRPIAFALALLVPVLALIGFFEASREIIFLATDPTWLPRAIRAMNLPDAHGLARLYALRDATWLMLAVLLALTLAARLGRQLLERRRGLVRLHYPGGRLVSFPPGMTVLEASRYAGIPHASVCGGRGRCSTCRVRVAAGAARLPPPGPEEARVLQRIGAAPGVRLACQIRPIADLEVMPLLPPNIQPRGGFERSALHAGQELEIAVLFADLRGFTSLTEHRLPFDTVFLLNRYFTEMGEAIESVGGHVDKFIGDGVMALFGLKDGPRWGAIAALTAAKRMGERLDALNRDLASELPAPLKLGIGIHTGMAIVGDMGYGEATALTAIGDVVNTASRIEPLTKDYDCQLVLSADTARHAGIPLESLPRHILTLRGRAQAIEVAVVKTVAGLEFSEERRSRPRNVSVRRAARVPGA